MALIEGIGDDVITILFVLFLLIIVVMSWLSTNVRDLPRPTSFYFIERNTGRLFTANNLDGNVHVLSSSSSNRQILTIRSHRSDPRGAQASPNPVPTRPSSLSHPETTDRASSDIDIVDELVEQALVDNLLDGNIYSSAHGIRPNMEDGGSQSDTVSLSSADNSGSESVAESPSGVVSGNGGVASSMADSDENSPGEQTTSEDFIDIFVRFVNEKEIKLRVKPNDTILVLKRTHFSQELSNNKIVRFIYQGQFLNEKATIKSYNIKDQTTIHCHITSKQASAPTPTSAFDSNPAEITTDPSTNQTTEPARSDGPTSQQRQQLEPVIDMIGLLLNHCILPLFAGLLTGCWYFRINFKHLFSPLTTLILVIFTFLYALFLFIYIHSTSAYAFNSFFLINRNLFVQRRQPIRHTHSD